MGELKAGLQREGTAISLGARRTTAEQNSPDAQNFGAVLRGELWQRPPARIPILRWHRFQQDAGPMLRGGTIVSGQNSLPTELWRHLLGAAN